MDRPRGNGKKSNEATSNDDDGSGRGGEEVAPTHKTRGRPQRPDKAKDDKDEAKDIAMVEEDGDRVKLVVSGEHRKSSVETNGGKWRRRRRRPKGSSDSVEEDDKSDDHARMKSNRFRQIGSRRKSTPRHAAEAGVDCK